MKTIYIKGCKDKQFWYASLVGEFVKWGGNYTHDGKIIISFEDLTEVQLKKCKDILYATNAYIVVGDFDIEGDKTPFTAFQLIEQLQKELL